MSWYVIQTKPLNEDRVCQQFTRVPEAETFCPKLRCLSVTKGEKFKPLFPNYVFLNWDLSDPKNHHTTKYTRGVNKILGDGSKAVPIADEIIEIIKGRANEGGIIEQKLFKQGDLVKVKRGYLKDLIGILEKPVSDSGRVAVLLQLFNRQLSVKLKCADICKA